MKSLSNVWVRVDHRVLGSSGPFNYESDSVRVRVSLGTTSLDSITKLISRTNNVDQLILTV